MSSGILLLVMVIAAAGIMTIVIAFIVAMYSIGRGRPIPEYEIPPTPPRSNWPTEEKSAPEDESISEIVMNITDDLRTIGAIRKVRGCLADDDNMLAIERRLKPFEGGEEVAQAIRDCYLPGSSPAASFCGEKAAGKMPGCFSPSSGVDDPPCLGLVTTGELLDELASRFEMNCKDGLRYKPYPQEKRDD